MTDSLQDAIARFQRCIMDRDRRTAEAVLHPDYALVLVQPARAVVPRARWLEVLADYIVHDYAGGESVLDVDGDTATVLHCDHMSATVLGEDRSGMFVITDVWRRM